MTSDSTDGLHAWRPTPAEGSVIDERNQRTSLVELLEAAVEVATTEGRALTAHLLQMALIAETERRNAAASS